ncbi:hypothetical protein [Erwinia sp. CGal63]|uniref:hypothetical protein n=1 Tax=Erwinia sp. CGal63 TaxID=2919889 RepID=UPI00300995BC
MKVLYIGSGISALQAREEKYQGHIIVCLNNAWRIFAGGSFDYWLHSGDFPQENYPVATHFKADIGYERYVQASDWIGKKLGWRHEDPEFYIGYTMFFQGLYWIMMALSPTTIGLLGFDHDYDQNKVVKWQQAGEPNIQNQFNQPEKVPNINSWSESFFKEFRPDFFYGHGTPDPLRTGLGLDYIKTKMQLADSVARQLGIAIVNYSERASPVEVFQRVRL